MNTLGLRHRAARRTLFAVLFMGVGAAPLSGFVMAIIRRRFAPAPARPLRVERSVVIERSPEEVFAFVSDPENDVRWVSPIEEQWKTSEGAPGVGTTYLGVGRFLGRRFEGTFEIAHYEPNRNIVLRPTSGPLQFTGSRTVEGVADGTRFTYAWEGQTGGFFWLLPDSLMVLVGQRQLDAYLANLKGVLETQS